jgi:two-component system response regulator YesN
VRKTAEKAADMFNAQILAGSGPEATTLEELESSFRKAKALLEFAPFIMTERSIVITEKPFFNRPYSNDLKHLMNQFQTFSLFNKNSQLVGLVDQIWNTIQRIPATSLMWYRDITMELAFFFYTSRKSSPHFSLMPAEIRRFISDELQHADSTKLKEWLVRFIHEQNSDPYPESPADPIGKRVVAYVHRNYRDCNICLKTLSGTFNHNPAYLGKIFKQETGEMFTDYVNRLRLEEAKRLLRSTDKKTQEIAEEVGYTQATYFYWVFKKYIGKSPTQYRRQKNN